MRQVFCFLLFLTGLPYWSNAQDFNIRSYTPSALLRPGQWEYQGFNNLYTQTAGFDHEANKQPYGERSSYFTSTHQLLYGIHEHLNIGAATWLKAVRIDEAESSALSFLSLRKSRGSRAAVAYMGPVAKWTPFQAYRRFAVQTSLLIPLAKDMQSIGVHEGKPFLERDRYLWISRFFHDWSWGDRWQLFLEAATWASFHRYGDAAQHSLEVPLKAIGSFFPSSRLTVYGMSEYWPQLGSSGIDAYFVQSGLGLKYQVIAGRLEIEGLYTRFLAGKRQGAGQAFNVGVRLIHW